MCALHAHAFRELLEALRLLASLLKLGPKAKSKNNQPDEADNAALGRGAFFTLDHFAQISPQTTRIPLPPKKKKAPRQSGLLSDYGYAPLVKISLRTKPPKNSRNIYF